MDELTTIQRKALELTGLNVKKKSSKGWVYGRCPFCNHQFKFGMKFNHDRSTYKNHLSFNCFRGKCGAKGTEYDLFKHFNVLYLLGQKEFIPTNASLDNSLARVSTDSLEIGTDIKQLPIGWTRIYDHWYLRQRGWEDWQFDQIHVGISETYTPLKDYLIFLIMENNQNRGHLCRSTWTIDKINQYNAHVKHFNKTCLKSQRKRFHPKYTNEAGVDFEKLLLGIDEITDKTSTTILVEGIFDKTNTDKQLSLNLSDEVKCLCTFGKKISEFQIEKLYKKGVKNIFLLYDPDAINASKQFGMDLSKAFKVQISSHPEKDPGEMNQQDFEYCLNTAKSPIDFYTNMLGKVL
jgi:hypothetical protein